MSELPFELEDIDKVIQITLEQISEKEEVETPPWSWSDTLITFSRYSVEKETILVDQIYKHIWEAYKARQVIWILIYYELAFCFYHYIHKTESNLDRENNLVPPIDEEARKFAYETTEMSAEEYTDTAEIMYGMISDDLIDYLIKGS